MQKLGFSGIKSLDQLRSMSGTISGTAKTFLSSSRASSDSISSGSFANLKLTAEKLVKEQASVKTDLEMANSKLKKSAEHIRALEEKLQNVINENAKLNVKQKEDAKLWDGLESKFTSTKFLCDQLTETLQHLACQVQISEQDKKTFEDKLCASSEAFDNMQLQMNDLSAKLKYTVETITNKEHELMRFTLEKEEMEKLHRDEQYRTANLMDEKDSMIKKLEETVAADKLAIENVKSRLEELHCEIRLKEDINESLRTAQKNMEKENSALQSSKEDFAKKLLASQQEIKRLKDFVCMLTAQLNQLDEQSLALSKNVVQLDSSFNTCYKLLQQEKEFTAKHTRQQFDHCYKQLLDTASEKDALQSINQELNNKVIELQKAQEYEMVQHAEECRLAEEKIRKLERDAEALDLKKTELEMLVTNLEEKLEKLSEVSSLSEKEMQNLLLKVSTLEAQNQDIQQKFHAELQKKAEEIDTLQKEIAKHEQHADLLEKLVRELRDGLHEKEQLSLQSKNREKQLEDQNAETQALLLTSESKLEEAKKQYDMMLESKQLELSKHLKEISQRTDQAINEIRRKYEMEKLEIVNLEKEKTDKAIGEIERKCEQKLAESREESRQYLLRVQEEHNALVDRIREEHDKKESGLRASHNEELIHAKILAENESREKILLVKKEHEAQVRALKLQHEDEFGKLHDELEIQKSKEEQQRALLQLQWKVMGNPQDDQEVNSKKDFSISSIKKRDTDGGTRIQHALTRQKNEKNSSFLEATRTPVSNLLKKVEKVNAGSVMDTPKHRRKVTHHEYEVETSNGRTITKRRKTKSTVMFADPRKHKTMKTPIAKSPKEVQKVIKGGGHSRPSNIGDLFTEGSLNPYVDDPYAFD